MTPKEKAKELVDRFSNISLGEDAMGNPYLMGSETIEEAKECALICVDESIKNLNPWKNSYMGRQQIKELQEVKQEIEKIW